MRLFEKYPRLNDKLADLYRQAFLSISLYTRGIKPKYRLNNANVIPANYTDEYKHLFDLILHRHPNEDEQINNWRRAVLPIEKAQEPLINAINQTKSVIFSNNQMQVSIDDEKASQYFSDLNDLIYDLYLARVEDPNGILAIIDLHEDKFENSFAMPKIIYVPSIDIEHKSEERIIFKYEGYYHELTKTYYIRYESKNGNAVPIFGYKHELNELPFVNLGGLKIHNEEIGSYYISDYAFYTGWARDYLQQESDHKAILKNASYPIPIMAKETCHKCNGVGKTPNKSCGGTECSICHGAGCYDDCETCGGVGQEKFYPGRTINFDVSTAVGGNIKASDLMAWSSPDMAAATHALEVLKYEREGIEKSLHQRNINESQSGEAKALDMAFAEANIRGISDDYFNVWNYIIGLAIKWFTYNKDINWSLKKPTRFEIKTTYELEEQYKRLKENNASKVVLDKAYLNVISSLYPNDEIIIKKESVIMAMDSLCHTSQETMDKLFLSGVITTDDMKLHFDLPKMVNDYVDKIGKESFIDKTINEVVNDLS